MQKNATIAKATPITTPIDIPIIKPDDCSLISVVPIQLTLPINKSPIHKPEKMNLRLD